MKRFINRKIYFEGGEEAKSKKELIEMYLDQYNPTTYYKTSGRVQCFRGKARSFHDMFYIMKTRFEDSTPEELADILVNKLGPKKVRVVRCGEIQSLSISNVNTNKLWGNRLLYKSQLCDLYRDTGISTYELFNLAKKGDD